MKAATCMRARKKEQLKNNNKIKVAIYTRVSTKMQVEKGISLDAQENELVEWCKKNGYEYDVYSDGGKSGGTIEKRYEFQRMMDNIYDYDIVLCYKLARIVRSVKDLANMISDFAQLGIRFISLNEGIDTKTPLGKLLAYIMGIIAEIERENISDYVKMARREEFEQGRITAKAVLGYDRVKKELILNRKEAKIVKFIFKTYDKIRNYYRVAQICNEKGYRGKNGSLFHASSIKTIIQNMLYCGYNSFHNEEFKLGKHTAIISLELYKRVNNIADNELTPKNNNIPVIA